MSERNELIWLINFFSKPLTDLWSALPTNYRPVVIIDSAECATPFDFLYILLESHLDSIGSLLNLNWENDRALINKLDELRILFRFIDSMSRVSPQLFERPNDVENPVEDFQDYHIWNTVRRVCLEITMEPMFVNHESSNITFESLYSKYKLCYLDSCVHKNT